MQSTSLATEPTLSSADLEQARTYLEQAQTGAAGAIKRLSQSQWTFKPAPDRWSIGEIVEHMITIQERILGPIREQLASAPAVPSDHPSNQVDIMVINHFPDRLMKFQAPPFVHPTGQLERDAALARLAANSTRLAEYLESTPDLRRHAIPAPPLKAVSKDAYQVMDGYQWILAAAAHTERHTKQILEVMADTRFPEA